MERTHRAIRQAPVAAPYEMLIVLLAATTMRSSEAIRLEADTIEWDEALLLVRGSTYNESRSLDQGNEAITAGRIPARISSSPSAEPT